MMLCRICFVAALCGVVFVADSRAYDDDDVSLENLLSQPVTTASKYWQEARLAPSSVSIVPQRDIRRFGWRTLDDVLRATAGFYGSYDRMYSYAGSRGFLRSGDYINKILLLLNGNTLNEGVYGSASVGTDFPLNPDIIERIEIVRGPGSVIYGTGAMLAVINVITRKPAALPPVEAVVEAGSFGRKIGRISGGAELGDFGVSYSGVVGEISGQDFYFKEFDRMYDTSLTTDGKATGLDGESFYSATAGITYENFSLRGVLYDRRKTIPTAPFDTKFGDTSATCDVRLSVEAMYEATLSYNMHLTARMYLNRYHYYGYWSYGDDITFDTTRNVWFGGELQYRWDISPEHKLSVGGEWKQHTQAQLTVTHSNGAAPLNTDTPYSVLSGYIQGESALYSDIFLTAGVRFDRYSHFGSAITPRVALVYSPSVDYSIKLLYGRAYRAPNLNEMYYEDPNSREIPNTGLNPETVETWEAVGEYQIAPEYNLTASLYNFTVNDIIEQTERPDSLVQYVNLNRVNSFGVEGALEMRLDDATRGYLRFGAQQVRTNTLEGQSSNAPVAILKTGMARQFFSENPFIAGIEALWESARNNDAGGETPGFFLLSANLDLSLFNRTAGLSLNVRNILDAGYSYPSGVSYRQPSIRQDGRWFIISARVHL